MGVTDEAGGSGAHPETGPQVSGQNSALTVYPPGVDEKEAAIEEATRQLDWAIGRLGS